MGKFEDELRQRFEEEALPEIIDERASEIIGEWRDGIEFIFARESRESEFSFYVQNSGLSAVPLLRSDFMRNARAFDYLPAPKTPDDVRGFCWHLDWFGEDFAEVYEIHYPRLVEAYRSGDYLKAYRLLLDDLSEDAMRFLWDMYEDLSEDYEDEFEQWCFDELDEDELDRLANEN